MFDLDSFIPSEPVKPARDEIAKVEAAGYNPVAVSDRSAEILDSALTGLPDEDITDLYAVLTVVSEYKTVKAVYESDESLHQFELTPDQYLYLYLIDSDIMPAIATKALKISKSQPGLWAKENKLFAAVLSAIKDGQADELESVVWREARYNPKASIERMFALKSRKTEYRDNAPMPTPPRLDLRITLDNADIDVSASYKDITPDDEAQE